MGPFGRALYGPVRTLPAGTTPGSGMTRVCILLMALLGCAAAQAAEWTQIVPSPTVTLRDASDLSISAEGLLYIADTGHHRVLAVDSTGKLVMETGGFGDTPGQFQ